MLHDPWSLSWKSRQTSGDIPPCTSGSTAQIFGEEMLIFCGFAQKHSDDLMDQIGGDLQYNVDDVFALNLRTWTWRRIETKGTPPFKCDKLVSWSFNKLVYVFGGFGPKKPEVLSKNVSFITDDNYDLITSRGWNNQLVIFNPETDTWNWPRCKGPVPEPRAALTVAVAGQYAYLFGGRLRHQRLNDLYRLDMRKHAWEILQPCIPRYMGTYPCGRSWHSLTVIQGKEDEAILYGGYDTDGTPLSDCWRLDLSTRRDLLNRWTRCRHLEKGNRLWHQSVQEKDTGQLWVIGGGVNDLLSDRAMEHPEKILKLNLSPLPLKRLSAVSVLHNFPNLSKTSMYLPRNLQELLLKLKETSS